jgi:RND family efflux transporter MFP subunit
MTAPVLLLSQWSEPTLSWGIEVAAKALVCGLLVYLVHLALGRRRVLLRSALWNAALVGLLILPVAIAFSPRWNLAVWPAQRAALPVGTGVVITTLDEADLSGITVVANEPIAAVVRSINYWPLCLCGLYLLGVCVSLLRFVRGLAGVARLRRHSAPVESAGWLDRLEHWHRELGLPAPVGLRHSHEVSVPLMMGSRAPVVIIPSVLSTVADRPTIDAVLLHELAHVGRNDYAWNLLLKLVQALYWFHPVGWCLGRILHQVREDACDAVCIHWLGGAREYVGVLVELVVSYVPRPAAALGMGVTRTSRLSRRLRRLSQGVGNARFALGRRMRGIGMIGVALVVLALGSARLAPRALADEREGGSAGQKTKLVQDDPQEEQRREVREVDEGADPTSDVIEATKLQHELERQRRHVGRALDAVAEKTGQKVAVVRVREGKIQDTYDLVSSLVGYEPLRVYPRLSGVVSKTVGNPGDVVKKGDILAQIEVPDAEIQIAKARAGVARAQADLSTAQVQLEASQAAIDANKSLIEEADADVVRAEASLSYRSKQFTRMQALAENKAVDTRLLDESEEQLTAAKADVKATKAKTAASKARLTQAEADARVKVALVRAAEVDVAAAKEALNVASMATLEESRVVRAPEDGVIAERKADIGEAVGADRKPIFILDSSSIIAARVHIPEAYVLRVKKGMPAIVTLSAAMATPHTGKLTQVGYVIDPNTRTFMATIALPNPEGAMRPGMSGVARIVLSEKELPVVPSSAVLRVLDAREGGAGIDRQKYYCFKWVGAHFVKVEVRLHSDDGKQAAIAEGLSVDDEVALDARSRAEPKEDPARQINQAPKIEGEQRS